jgi:hypothetical protein
LPSQTQLAFCGAVEQRGLAPRRGKTASGHAATEHVPVARRTRFPLDMRFFHAEFGGCVSLVRDIKGPCAR